MIEYEYFNYIIEKELGNYHSRRTLGMGVWHGICTDATNRRRRIFCGVIVTVVRVTMGIKYGIAMAVVGVVWMVIALIVGSQYGWSKSLSDFLL